MFWRERMDVLHESYLCLLFDGLVRGAVLTDAE